MFGHFQDNIMHLGYSVAAAFCVFLGASLGAPDWTMVATVGAGVFWLTRRMDKFAQEIGHLKRDMKQLPCHEKNGGPIENCPARKT